MTPRSAGATNPRAAARRGWLRRGVGFGLWLPLAMPLGLLLGSCGLGGQIRRDFYVLGDEGPPPAAGGAAIELVLLVASGAMPGLYDSDRMIFSADGRSRSYFQFGYWSERPAQSLQLLAEARLDALQRFRTVASSTSGLRGDLLLSLRLDELYLDASADPALLRVSMSAELIDWRSRKLLARQTFRRSHPAASRDAGGAAQAASHAVGAMLAELSDWVGATAQRAAAGA
jgi:cholesterol transport system auxiliary component